MTNSSNGFVDPASLPELRELIRRQELAEIHMRTCSDAYGQAEIALHRAAAEATQARDAVKNAVKEETVVDMGNRWLIVNSLGVLREVKVIK